MKLFESTSQILNLSMKTRIPLLITSHAPLIHIVRIALLELVLKATKLYLIRPTEPSVDANARMPSRGSTPWQMENAHGKTDTSDRLDRGLIEPDLERQRETKLHVQVLQVLTKLAHL